MPLVPPLETAVTPAIAELAAFFDETLGFTPNSVLTMQRRPEIVEAFITLNRAVMMNTGRVTAEQKRFVGMLASLASGCRYCQAHTALAATRYGASRERLDAIWEYQTSPLFTDAERAAFDFAVAAASVPNAVSDEVGAALRAHWTAEEIVEILGVVSLFGFLNRWNDSMGTSIEAGAEAFASDALAARGWTRGKHG